jgi:hypothetical protein
MKRSAMDSCALLILLLALLAGSVQAGPPLSGAYKSTDIGGLALIGRYTEGWDGGGGAHGIGTTLNAESWDGSALGTQWKYWCATEVADGVLLVDLVDANGNGSRTYMDCFVGGYIWLSGTGPWGNGDPDYPGVIDRYYEYETVMYQNWVPISAVTNVQALAHFDNYPTTCMTFYISNGTRVATTDLGETIPAGYPGLLNTNCEATRTHGACWDMCALTLNVNGCNVGTQESTWGAIKSMYKE